MATVYSPFFLNRKVMTDTNTETQNILASPEAEA